MYFIAIPKHIPIKQRRGIDCVDLNDYFILVKAPIEQVAQGCHQWQQVLLWKRDVYERKMEIQGCSYVVFQLQEHPWTLMHGLKFSPDQKPITDEDLQMLSGLLSTRVIYYYISDTGGKVGYHLFDSGESIESLKFESQCLTQEDEYKESPGIYQFQSRLRQLTVEDIGNPYNFTDKFLREQDAYIPPIKWDDFRFTQQITFQLESFRRDDFERIDYMVMN